MPMFSYADAFFLSIVEGLTEFIPVSSTGHMILLTSLLGIQGDSIKTFEIFIQLGAILSVIFLFPHRFIGLIPGSNPSGSVKGLKGVEGILKFVFACLPVFVLGFIFHQKIKHFLFSPLTVALALIVGGVALVLVERRSRSSQILSLDQISFKTSFFIGLFQCLALWPGISRSGATIIGGMLMGLERRVAAEFSFLVAVPVMSIAVGYDLLKSLDLLTAADLPIFMFGFVSAFIISLFAVKFFFALLNRITLEAFGWYRILVGVVVLLSISNG